MQIVDSGVLTPSFMEFSTPSTFARENLYYVTQYGHFVCDRHYHIQRDRLDLFLFIYINAGTLHINVGNKDYIAEAGNIVLLDCRNFHRYFCEDSVDFTWFHFWGNNSVSYGEYLYEKIGVVFTPSEEEHLEQCFSRILNYLPDEKDNQHKISLQIGVLFTRLASPRKVMGGTGMMEPVFAYVRQNFDREITLDQLARACSLSKSYFIHVFKQEVGSTPHDYVLSYRLRQSKNMLISTKRTVEQIAEDCGFNSASHFARAFRKDNGMSPSEFRELRF